MGIQCTSTEFKEEFQTRVVHLMLADMEHKEMNGKVKLTWRTVLTFAHSLMVYVRFLEAYIHFVLMYTADNIFSLPPIKDLINKYVKPTTPFQLVTGGKRLVSHLRM